MDDDDFDDEMMDWNDESMDEEISDELDDIEFTDDETDLEDGESGDEDQEVDNQDDKVPVGTFEEARKPNRDKPEVGYCHICGAPVLLDELPDSISRDAFEQFGLCLNCQWGFFMDNGGHF